MSEMTSQLSERKAQLELELARMVRVLSADATVEKMIVFGSLASGEIHEWSDIDLLVVKETDKRFIERLHEVRLSVMPQEAVDFVVYTPHEFYVLAPQRRFVREEIVEKGRVVYERQIDFEGVRGSCYAANEHHKKAS